ncbi:MAG: hypothetical protein E6H52_00060, partial [Betaproteobacteria bacterium]
MPTVRLNTTMGSIILELDRQRAPRTVENFLNYARSGHYNNTLFHRVINGFMIQGGGFEPGMRQKPTSKPIENEATNGLKNVKYTIAMARTSDPHSATAQFFINVADNAAAAHRAAFCAPGRRARLQRPRAGDPGRLVRVLGGRRGGGRRRRRRRQRRAAVAHPGRHVRVRDARQPRCAVGGRLRASHGCRIPGRSVPHRTRRRGHAAVARRCVLHAGHVLSGVSALGARSVLATHVPRAL